MKILDDMPLGLYSQHAFEIQRVDYSAPEGSGRIGGVQSGFPLWQAIYTIDSTLLPDESDEATAFKDRIRGATRRFIGRDISRLYPKAHAAGFDGMLRAGGGTFDGSATSWSEAMVDGDSQVTLEGLPEGLTLGKRDYIGFSWVATSPDIAGLTWHACVRVNVGGAADDTGALTVTSEPPVPLAVPAGATAYLNRPGCIMTLITEQSTLQPLNYRLAIQGGQFAGVQDIRS